MTSVVGIETPHGVLIGGDSLTSNGSSITLRRAPKVFAVGPYVFGVSGSLRLEDLLRFMPRLPAPPRRRAARHLVTKVVPVLRALLSQGGMMQSKGGVEEYEGAFLLGVAGELYEVHQDLQMARMTEGYGAVGSGYQVALGALHATDGMQPRRRLRQALEAAEAHTPFVRRPFRYVLGPASV